VEAVARAIGPHGVDLVIDTVGGQTLQDSVECLAYRGRIVSLGRAGRDPTPFQTMPLWRKNGALFGLYLLASLEHEHRHTYEVIAECIRRVAAGELRAIVARSFPLAQAAAAHAYVEGRAAFGRVVLRPGG
jgi:NADPH2:quinone reductase